MTVEVTPGVDAKEKQESSHTVSEDSVSQEEEVKSIKVTSGEKGMNLTKKSYAATAPG